MSDVNENKIDETKIYIPCFVYIEELVNERGETEAISLTFISEKDFKDKIN